MSAPTRRLQQIIEDGRYAISEVLGSGGMGIVYLARDRVLGRKVALKVLRESYGGSEEFVERFRREANNAAALSHPNIVAVYDRGEPEDGSSYIAMEYVGGGTLKDLIAREAPLPPEEAARMALQVANALNEAHRRGIVHRDIKSENVLLTEEGVAKVADFGIARAAEATAMTHTNQVFGTVSYVSPEQAAGDKVGPESDLYSLGILLYEMLAGEVPFEAESPIGVAIKHVREEPVPVEKKNPKVPAELAVLTMALLSKDPAARPSPAGQVATQLERFLEGETAVAPPDTSAVGLASASGSPPAEAENGAATRMMKRVAPAGAIFRRGKTAAFLCGVAALALACLFVVPRYDLAGRDTSSSFTPVVEPKASGVGAPDNSGSVTGDVSKQVKNIAEKPPSPSESNSSGSHSGSAAATSSSEPSDSVASAAAEQSTSSASATSSATPSATASPSTAGSVSTAAPQPAPDSSAGISRQPAPVASPPKTQGPSVRPQPQPQSRPAPKPAAAAGTSVASNTGASAAAGPPIQGAMSSSFGKSVSMSQTTKQVVRSAP